MRRIPVSVDAVGARILLLLHVVDVETLHFISGVVHTIHCKNITLKFVKS